ncbi:hypothetical protein HKCCE3408_09215 [Rhodobacterales bacterium HKCCE3408]|nr:hypothetical protein [Rhodobacterales bacterium HKCCE3408]
MKPILTTVFAISSLAMLSGCIDDSAPPPAGNDPEAAARAACVRDVRSTTGNPDVVVSSSSFSEAGTEVILTVGGTGTWRCIAYRDGSTAGIESLTNEGFL